MAVIDLGNIRINWRGAYNAAAGYVQDDAVSYHGSSFIALRDVTGVTPVVGADWDVYGGGQPLPSAHRVLPHRAGGHDPDLWRSDCHFA